MLGTIVCLCGGRAPFVFNDVVGMGVRSGGGLSVVVLCADFERVFVGQGGDNSGKENTVSDGTDKHTDPDNTLPVRVALLQEQTIGFFLGEIEIKFLNQGVAELFLIQVFPVVGQFVEHTFGVEVGAGRLFEGHRY